MPPDFYVPHAEFDVYRDHKGDPVTITPEHCAGKKMWSYQQYAAFLHAWTVRTELVRRHNGDQAERMNDLRNVANVGKSRLLGRMLYEGKPPLQDPPPLLWGGPDYSVEETDD